MKILCVSHDAIGHTDFGGNGFIKIAKGLVEKGYTVQWLTGPKIRSYIESAGLSVLEIPELTKFKVDYFGAIFDSENPLNTLAELRSCIKSFQSYLDSIKPSVLIIDRLLSLAAIAADNYGIPYIAMGTPGGNWKLHGGSATKESLDPSFYQGLSELLFSGLKWKKCEITSSWAVSPVLNCTFLGKSFYKSFDKNSDELNKGMFVNHYDSAQQRAKEKAIGVSFGNTGNIESFGGLLGDLVREKEKVGAIDVYVGQNRQLKTILQNIYSNGEIRIHEWLDFSKNIGHLKALIFMGGIGTTWHCVNRNLPMIVKPECRGDQIYNSSRIDELGLGINLNNPAYETGNSVESIVMHIESGEYCENIKKFRNEDNYTDTMDSALERIENII